MKKSFSLFLLGLFVLSSCGVPEVQLQKYYTTRTAELSSIDVTESYVGYLEGDIVTTLSSEVPGKVLATLVREGQEVKQGSSLLSINVDSSVVGYQGSQDIIASLSVMQQSISLSFDAQATLIESQIRQAQIEQAGNTTALKDTLNIQEKQVLANESSVLVAKENLILAETEKSETEKIFITKKSQLLTNAKNAVTGLMIIDTNVASFLDEIFALTPENKHKNFDYKQFLGAKNTTQKDETIVTAKKWFIEFTELEKLYEMSILDVQNPPQKDLELVLMRTLTLNNSLKSLLSEVYKVFENSIESIPQISEQTIQQRKNEVSTFGSQIEQALLNASGNMLMGAQAIDQNLTSLEDERQKALALLDNKISLLQAQLDNVEKNINITPSVNTSQVNQNTIQKALIGEKITQLQESLKNLDASKKARLAEVNSQITQAQVEGSLQGLSAGKGEITSPLSGVVTKKYIERGSVVQPGQPLFEISDTSSKKIDIHVSTDVVGRLSLQETAFILFEGKDAFIEASVALIYPFQDELSRKTQVELRSGEFAGIPLGSRATIYLSTQESKGVTIPKKTIVEQFGTPGVYVIFNNTAEFRHIEIIEQNDDIAVVSGIQTGDEVILLGKENIFDGESLQGYTLLPE